jgi:hypothetical protein
LIGRGEPDHSAITQLLRWWNNAGGKLIASEPSLLEAHRHCKLAEKLVSAWITKCRQSKGSLRRQRTIAPTANVFLRSAIAQMGVDIAPSRLLQYINQFLPRSSDASSSFRRILEADFGFVQGPQLQIDLDLYNRLYQSITAARLKDEYDYESEAENARSRCRHDAALLSYLAAYRESLKGTDCTAVILSHATHLRRVHEAFHGHFGFMSPCVDPARLMFAISLSPGSAFTMASLQSVLFGTAFRDQVRRHENLATKVMVELASGDDGLLYTPAMANKVDERLATVESRRAMVRRSVELPKTEWP